MSHPIEFLPPSATDIEHLARRICQHFADTCDPSFNDPEVVSGLAEFMQIAACIQSHHLNSVQSVDKSHE